jgi:hypothetical protein
VDPFAFLGGGVTTSLSFAGALSAAGDLNAGDRVLAALAGFDDDATRDPGAALCFVDPFSSSVWRGRLLSEILQKPWKSFSRLLKRSLTTLDFGAADAGGCLEDVAAALLGLGDDGLGLAGRFPVVLEAVVFLGSAFAGGEAGRGERPEWFGVLDGKAEGFLPDTFAVVFSTPLGVPRSRLGFAATISSSRLSSAANASSIAFGSVGLSIGGSAGRVGVTVRRGGERRDDGGGGGLR